MAKYKLKEVEVGDVDIKSGRKSTVTSIDPTTGAISWDVTTVPEMDTTFKKFAQLRDYIEQLSVDKKEDPKFREIAKKVIANFNDFRTHLRTNYPDEYKMITRFLDLIIEVKKVNKHPDLHMYNFGYDMKGNLKCLDI